MTPKQLKTGLREQIAELKEILQAIPEHESRARMLCKRQINDCRYMLKITKGSQQS